MSGSDASAKATQDRDLVAWAALVLSTVGIVLWIYTINRFSRIDSQPRPVDHSHEDLESKLNVVATRCDELTRDQQQMVQRLDQVSSRCDLLAEQNKELFEARQKAGTKQEAEIEGVNLLLNGSFEDKAADERAANWYSVNVGGQHEGPRTKAVLDTDVKLKGNTSLRIDHVEEGQYTYTCQSQRTRGKLKPNTDYIYTGHFRVKGIVPHQLHSSGIKLLITHTDEHAPLAIGDQPNYRFEGEWQKLELRFNTGDSDPIHCAIMFHRCKGTIWVDDLRLEEAGALP